MKSNKIPKAKKNLELTGKVKRQQFTHTPDRQYAI